MEQAAAIQAANRTRPGIEPRLGSGFNLDGPARPLQSIDGNQAANPGQLVNYSYSPPLPKLGALNPDNSSTNPAQPYHDGFQQLLMIGQVQIGWKWQTSSGGGSGGPTFNSTPKDSKTGTLLGGVDPNSPNNNPPVHFVDDLPAGFAG
ncbi:hypothetical protein AU375_02323 [Methylobacterium radiotolerans]|nr:hypothetical protein AU375_02323 [Methylobacterium radiotolerans]